MGRKLKGFSLIELMIAVVIVGVLAAIAYPAYNDYMIRARRTDAQGALMNLAALMEQYYTMNNTYVGANAPADVGGGATSPEGLYNLSISNVTATSYTLTATPVVGGVQAQDTVCGALSITSTNVKSPNPNTCW